MKRIATSFLACLMILTFTCGAAGATFTTGAAEAPVGTAEALGDMGPMASLYLTKYNISMSSGYSSGELRISYIIGASKATTKVGVSQIKIYQTNGTLVTTIYGSAANGLLRTDGASTHGGDYSYYATSGFPYYAVVVAYAEDASGSDAKIVTTSTVIAP